jgi:hypothetical protein
MHLNEEWTRYLLSAIGIVVVYLVKALIEELRSINRNISDAAKREAERDKREAVRDVELSAMKKTLAARPCINHSECGEDDDT